jgi:outer membrane lipopolysaccharide assembly protein LptE/RlpB
VRKALVALFVSLLPACGYQLVRTGGAPLRVGTLKNPTSQAEAGGLFATALREQLAARARLAEEGGAGPSIEGELLNLRTSPSVLAVGTVGALRVEADLKLRVLEGGAVKAEQQVGGGEEYLQGVDVLGTEANRRAALRRLAEQLVRSCLERLEADALLPR